MSPINARVVRLAELVQGGLQDVENTGALRRELAGEGKQSFGHRLDARVHSPRSACAVRLRSKVRTIFVTYVCRSSYLAWRQPVTAPCIRFWCAKSRSADCSASSNTWSFSQS